MPDNHDAMPPHNNQNNDEREPRLMRSRTGHTISVFGLVERIVTEFQLEHGERDSEILKASISDVERRQLVRDVAEYVFGVESAHLSPSEQARMIALAYGELFGYGPLDDFFADEAVTTITLEGARKIGVRYGVASDLEMIDPIFEDAPHMRRIVKRLVDDAGAVLRDDLPIIETGLTIAGRRVSLSIAAPPFVPDMAVDIRVHPSEAPTIDDWVDADILNQQAVDLLRAIAVSEHGIIIIGDTESGKTTLTSLLLHELDGDGLITVERASELHLAAGATRLATQWPVEDDEGITFGQQIQIALEQDAHTIAIDEIRTDEPQSIAPLLTGEDIPRQIWSFRGTSESKRLTSALGMLARMSDSTQPEHMVYQLQQRLPFVVVIKRRKGRLQLREIAEWQFADNAASQEDFVYADYVPLMRVEWDGMEITGKRPQHMLDLPDTFWSTTIKD